MAGVINSIWNTTEGSEVGMERIADSHGRWKKSIGLIQQAGADQRKIGLKDRVK